MNGAKITSQEPQPEISRSLFEAETQHPSTMDTHSVQTIGGIASWTLMRF